MKNLRSYGSKPFKCVVVHGGPGAPGSASSLARQLSKNNSVLEPFQTEKTVFGQVDELYNQITQNTLNRVFVFGHSWGAWITYLLAYKNPEIIEKTFLIGSGVFDASYLPELEKRRLSALSKNEQLEYKRILSTLSHENADNDKFLKRLGELAEKADYYHVEKNEENNDELITIDGNQYQNVWNEASEMRKNGFFIEIAKEIKCPIRVVHGNKDTTPIEGVVDPIKEHIKDLKWFEIEECGHSPWKEKYGKGRFFEIVNKEMNT
ncbi:MAG: alpha/beta hydrolase [Thermodesulfobacteriota bacterium]|nr:alpha/beta hydrolase [Thermodesulfobacteriota bacterium]